MCAAIPLADKELLACISETKKLAQHMLPLVKAALEAAQQTAEPDLDARATLERVVGSVGVEVKRTFMQHGLRNIKQFCSGKPGAIGKGKAPRGSKLLRMAEPDSGPASEEDEE